MSDKIKLAAASNVEAPCYQILKELAFDFKYIDDMWVVENDKYILKGYSQLELLGLFTLLEQKGENWHVSDDAIDEFLGLVK